MGGEGHHHHIVADTEEARQHYERPLQVIEARSWTA